MIQWIKSSYSMSMLYIVIKLFLDRYYDPSRKKAFHNSGLSPPISSPSPEREIEYPHIIAQEWSPIRRHNPFPVMSQSTICRPRQAISNKSMTHCQLFVFVELLEHC